MCESVTSKLRPRPNGLSVQASGLLATCTRLAAHMSDHSITRGQQGVSHRRPRDPVKSARLHRLLATPRWPLTAGTDRGRAGPSEPARKLFISALDARRIGSSSLIPLRPPCTRAIANGRTATWRMYNRTLAHKTHLVSPPSALPNIHQTPHILHPPSHNQLPSSKYKRP